MIHIQSDCILFSIFHELGLRNCHTVSRTCKALRTAFVNYAKVWCDRRTTGGVSLLRYHQVDMITWLEKRLASPSLYGRMILCNAYTSAGKTLVALETCFRYLSGHDGFGVIYLLPTVQEAWIQEIAKHYPDETRQNDTKKILVIKRQKDMMYVTKHIDKMNGKIVVMTPYRDTHNSLCRAAAIVAFDEPPQTDKSLYRYVLSLVRKTVPCIVLTNSMHSVNAASVELVVDADRGRFPTIRFEYVAMNRSSHSTEGGVRELVGDLLDSDEAEHACLVLPNLTEDSLYYGYNKKMHKGLKKCAYAAYVREGGVLVTSIKKISKGNNLNNTSSMYILLDADVTVITIQQCVCRVYRESNVHRHVRITFLYDDPYKYVQARLASILSYKWTICKTRRGVLLVIDYLDSIGEDYRRLSDPEFLVCFGRVPTIDCAAELTVPDRPENLSVQNLIRCSLLC
jgi:hypothetical protein